MRGDLTRRDLLKVSGAAAAGALLGAPLLTAASKPPTAPVAVGTCKQYGPPAAAALNQLFDKLGGLGKKVKGKTVSIKVNLTGTPQVFQGREAGRVYYPHADLVLATCQALARAGARRIRLLEGWPSTTPAEKFLGSCGWDLQALGALPVKVEFENTNNLGSFKTYSVLKPRHGGYIYPAFMINRSYEETDFLVSLAKMKNHYNGGGVTLALKNLFGVAPSSFYGDDAGTEQAGRSRMQMFHYGRRQPPSPAAAEMDPATSREAGYRVPRIVVDLVNTVHPIDLSIVDGIETMAGGEGPWIRNAQVRLLEPGLLVAGLNPVCTDAVCVALMGYDPRAQAKTAPFPRGDNHLTLAESAGLGSTDLTKIDVRGVPIKKAVYPFEPKA